MADQTDPTSSWKWFTEPYDVDRPLPFFQALGEFVVGDIWQRGMTWLDQTAIEYPRAFLITMLLLFMFPYMFTIPGKIIGWFLNIFADEDEDAVHARRVRITTYNSTNNHARTYTPGTLPTYAESVPLLRQSYVEIQAVYVKSVPIWARVLAWGALVLAVRSVHLHKSPEGGFM